ncbi:MAG: GDSL family lipase [Acidobacteria bacterium]|nr:MAG: GDSL family lipase [Acidobacteriota bacterium]
MSARRLRVRHVRVLMLIALALTCGACARFADRVSRGDKMRVGAEQQHGQKGATKDEQDGATTQTSAPIVYVALGDSTGVGVGARRGGGYVARLFERIERVRPGSRVVNLCMSGARTDDALRGQVARVAALHPTLVTVGIGINDVTNNVPFERFAANYEQIITRLRAATDAPIVATNIPDISPAPAVPEFARAEAARRIALFNERIAQIAAQQQITLVDAYDMSREIIPAHPEFFSADGFHPSDEGYEYWAKMMWPAVKTAIGE